MKRFYSIRSVGFVFGWVTVSSLAQVNVLTYHNNNSRTGVNFHEKILTPANVRAATFGKLFNYAVDGHIYAQPLYVSGLSIPGRGTNNVVFVATQHNTVYAFDADSSSGADGGVLWRVNLGPSAATPNPDFGNRFGGFNEISPEVGITGTPVIDLAAGTLYVDAFTHIGTNYFHSIHALNIVDGSERSSSPTLVQASCPGRGVGSIAGSVIFESKQQLQRSALTLAGGMLYVAYASYAVTDPYHGWVLGFDSQSLRLMPGYVFNTTPNGTIADFGPNAGEGGIWMGGGGLCAEGNDLFFSVGNGFFDAFPNSTGTEYGDSLIKLSTGGGLSVADYFAPYNHEYLADNDLDLGSGGVVLLSDPAGRSPRLMVCGGKQGRMYVVNRDQMTSDNAHVNTVSNVDRVVQTFSIAAGSFSTPAWFNNRLYIVPSGKPIVSLALLNTGLLDTNPISYGTRTFNFPGATPSISADDTRNGIVWVLKRDTSAVLVAYDATNLTQEIYSSDQSQSRDRLPEGVKFAVPTVVNGKVYVGTKGGLFVFGLLGSSGGTGTTNITGGSTNISGGVTNVPGGSASLAPGSFNGLFFEPDGARLERSGSFTASITRRGTYTGVLQTSAGRFSISGRTNASGAAAGAVLRRGFLPLTFAFQADPADSNRVAGAVSGIGWSAELIAYRALTHGPTPLAGCYTLILPGAANGAPQLPQGDGYAAVVITSRGSVRVIGALADGSKLTQSTMLSQGGEWCFFAFPGGRRQQILGFLNATGAMGDAGQLIWTKSTNSGPLFPQGFSLQMNVLGSRFNRPSANAPLLNFSHGVITLTGGNLPSDLSGSVTISSNNKVRTESDLKLVVIRTSGWFSGSIDNPDTGRRIRFNGALLQNQSIGSGYFLAADQSGRVTLQPR